MAELIQFELVSPEAKLVEKPVRLAVMPGEAGEFGVGANHTALVAQLKVGIVKLYADDQTTAPERIFITGGFADVTNETCVVLAEEAVNVRDLKADDLQKKLDVLQHDLALADEQADRARFQTQINVVNAKLKAIAA